MIEEQSDGAAAITAARLTRNVGREEGQRRGGKVAKSTFFLSALVRRLLPGIAEVATLTVDCDAGEKIQQKIALAKPGDTVLVSGTCRENLAISSEVVRITLDGQGKAVIQAPGTTADAIFIRGKDITVKGFTLTGGRDGIHLSGAAAGASATIDGNTIQRTGKYGIHLDSGSVGRIVNNRIENIPNVGIDITENSYARIGVRGAVCRGPPIALGFRPRIDRIFRVCFA